MQAADMIKVKYRCLGGVVLGIQNMKDFTQKHIGGYIYFHLYRFQKEPTHTPNGLTECKHQGIRHAFISLITFLSVLIISHKSGGR